MMCRILFCQLSCPLILSEVALSQLFERVLPKFQFENIFVTSHDAAVVWVHDNEAAVDLVKKGCINLDESSTASFSSASNERSRYVEIESSDSQHISAISEAIKNTVQDVLLFQRNQSVLISFSTRAAATVAYSALNAIFAGWNTVRSVHSVMVAEHSLVKCKWRRGAAPEKTQVLTLTSDEQTLTALVQSALNLRAEQPLVLHVQNKLFESSLQFSVLSPASTRSGNMDTQDLLLICPTKCDADALYAAGAIELPGGSIIDFSNSPHSKSRCTTPSFHCTPSNPPVISITNKPTILTMKSDEGSTALLRIESTSVSDLYEMEDHSSSEENNSISEEHSSKERSSKDSPTSEYSPSSGGSSTMSPENPHQGFTNPTDGASPSPLLSELPSHTVEVNLIKREHKRHEIIKVSSQETEKVQIIDKIIEKIEKVENAVEDLSTLLPHTVSEPCTEEPVTLCFATVTDEPTFEPSIHMKNINTITMETITKPSTTEITMETKTKSSAMATIHKPSTIETIFRPSALESIRLSATGESSSAETTMEADVAAELSPVHKDRNTVPDTLPNNLPPPEVKAVAHAVRQTTAQVLPIESYVIANHYKSLIRWSVDPDSTASSNASEFPFINKCKKGEKRNLIFHQSIGLSSLSWSDDGVNQFEKDDKWDKKLDKKISIDVSTEDVNETEGTTSVTLSIDTKNKVYSLTVRAPSRIENEERVSLCENLMRILDTMSRRVTLSGWLPQHREAINQSEKLHKMEDLTKSTVLFHNSKEKIISADVISLRQPQQTAMLQFLSGLKPSQTEWSIPYAYISSYSIPIWTEIQAKYAIKVNAKWKEMAQKGDADWTYQQNTKKILKVWGFDTYIEKAHSHIVGNRSGGHYGHTNPQNYANMENASGGGSISGSTTGGSGNSSGSASVAEAISTKEKEKEKETDKEKEKERQQSGKERNQKENEKKREEEKERQFEKEKDNVEEKGRDYEREEKRIQSDNHMGLLARGRKAEPMAQPMQHHVQEYDDDDYDDEDEYDEEEEEIETTIISRSHRDSKDQKSFRGQFAFQDRESGMFFQAFETEFTAYLWQTYSARITLIETPAGRAGKSGSTGSHSKTPLQRRAPLLKLEFSAASKKDVFAVRSYFEKFATFNFPRHQIHYPRCHGAWFKEINTQKEKNDASLRMIRRQSIQRANIGETVERVKERVGKDGGASNGERMPDPLMTAGFLNIRMKPPLHSRGVRRMTLPTDLTITICGPLNTEAQKSDYHGTYEQLAVLDSHYVTATVQIPLKSGVARTIAVRSTREDFITAHGLIALKWEENTRRNTDCMTNYDDTSSTGSDGSGVNSCLSRGGLSDDQMGTAKIWTTKADTMKNVLEYLCTMAGGAYVGTGDTISSLQSLHTRVADSFNIQHLKEGQSAKFLPPTFPPQSLITKEREIAVSMDSYQDKSSLTPTSLLKGDGSIVSRRNSVPPGFAPLPTPSYRTPTVISPTAASGIGATGFGVNSGRMGVNSGLGVNSGFGPHGGQISPDVNSIGKSIPFSSLDTSSPQMLHPVPVKVSTPPSQIPFQPNRNDLSPQSKINAAPGLTLPNDWEKLLQKVENSSPLVPNQQSNQLSPKNLPSPYNVPFERASSQSRHTQNVYGGGFTPLYSTLSPSPSPTSAFTPIGGVSAKSYRDTGASESPSTGLGMSLSGIAGGLGLSSYAQKREPAPSGVFGASLRSSLFPDSVGYGNTYADQYPYPQHQLPVLIHQQHQQQVSRQHPQMAPHLIESRTILHWPHPSFRFMFLGDPLKHQLSELLHKYRVRGVGITTPFRDKSNPTACLSIEGTNEGVAAATQHVNAYFRSVTYLIRSVTMVLTAAQREKLTSSDLTRVKEIQGTTGVHIVLDPQPEDIADALSNFDLRLPLSDSSHKAHAARYGLGAIGGYCMGGELPNTDAVPLITVRVLSPSGRSVDVSVVTNSSGSAPGGGGSSWGVSSLLLFVDQGSYATLSPMERDTLNRGEALVNTDPQTGKVVIRVRPKVFGKECSSERLREHSPDRDVIRFDASDFNRNDEKGSELHDGSLNGNDSEHDGLSSSQKKEMEIEKQAAALVEAVSEGLAAADALHLTGLALTAPLGNLALSALSENLIRTLTVEATVSVLRRANHFSLQKIVCVDLSVDEGGGAGGGGQDSRYPGYATQIGGPRSSTEVTQNNETLLQPACGNRMAFALLLLLEQDTLFTKNAEQQREIELQNRQNDPFSVLNNRDSNLDDLSRISTIRMIVCNIPLPCAMPAQSVYPMLRIQQRRTSSGALGYASYGGFDPSFLRSMGGFSQQPYGEYRYEEQGVIVIRGLPAGILRAVRAIKSLVATSSISY